MPGGPAVRPGYEEWSIQPAAIYHRYDVGFGNVLWVVCHGQDDIFDRFKRHTRPTGRACDLDFHDSAASFRTTLGVHCLYAHWATSQWRPRIKHLEQRTNQLASSLTGHKCSQLTL